MRTIAILCGGGPAPGINTVVATVTKVFLKDGFRVLAIHEGYKGLFAAHPEVEELTYEKADQIYSRGGSAIKMSRFKPEDQDFTTALFVKEGIELLVTIGGDDTASTANRLTKYLAAHQVNIRNIHVPKTIDNDLPLPEGIPTFGFTSAKEMGVTIGKVIKAEASTTQNWYLLMSMGREAGHLAFEIGKGIHASMIIIPEMFNKTQITIDKIVRLIISSMIKRRIVGQKFGVVVVGEGIFHFLQDEDIASSGITFDYDAHGHPELSEVSKAHVISKILKNRLKELNLDIIIMVVITVNIAIVMMVLAFILSGLVAERVTRPLQMLNDKLKKMHVGGKNEKIVYNHADEVGRLVEEYNNMVDKLDESIVQLAKSERESAWREMARQIAHEIKNPLTPMKLNIQFMLRSLQMEDTEKFKERFRAVSGMLIEQIDNMAAIASAFSDFAKMSEAHNETFEVDELVRNCSLLFKNNTEELECDVEEGIRILADREQMRRVLINLLKNAEQSIPEGRQGVIRITVRKKEGKVEIRIRDNGQGIPENLREKIFQPNFTTKSSGMGLGLAICKRIIESMGGEIGFVSEVGGGTEFFIILDIVRA